MLSPGEAFPGKPRGDPDIPWQRVNHSDVTVKSWRCHSHVTEINGKGHPSLCLQHLPTCNAGAPSSTLPNTLWSLLSCWVGFPVELHFQLCFISSCVSFPVGFHFHLGFISSWVSFPVEFYFQLSFLPMLGPSGSECPPDFVGHDPINDILCLSLVFLIFFHRLFSRNCWTGAFGKSCFS